MNVCNERVFVSVRVFARYRARKVPTCSKQQNVSQEETGAFSHSLAGKLGDCVSNRIKFWHAEKKFKFDTVFDKNFIVRKLNLFEHIL